MTPFERIVTHTLGIEGRFANDAADSGGATMLGITEAVARANGYDGDMRDLSLDKAIAIYRRQYWDAMHLDEVAALSESIAGELFDTGVNCGIMTAGKFLQRSLNALNRRAQDYPDVVVDGSVGPVSVASLAAFLAKRGRSGEVVLMRALNSLQGAHYIALSELRQKDEAFVFGWLLNRVV